MLDSFEETTRYHNIKYFNYLKTNISLVFEILTFYINRNGDLNTLLNLCMHNVQR